MKRIDTDKQGFSGAADNLIRLSVHPSIRPSVHPSIRLSVHPSIRLSVYLFILFSFLHPPASAQSTAALPDPWSGGLNSCQFCPVDINLDGIEDLLVFDRHGNRIVPYLRTSWGLVPAPGYAGLFPDLHDWVIGADYNCDGRTDLFTYSLGGARVFENVSDTVLQFQLVTSLLKSFYYSGYVGILMTPVDYPAISDIDGDGDLDILTFFGLGSYVEYHRNMSLEKFGNCDSLDLILSDHCWGNFKESEGSNRITLGVICPYKYSNEFSCAPDAPPDGPKHTGSTLLATDLNGDGVKDLLLGDIDFPNLIALSNGGTPDSANMTGQDTLFPSYDVPLTLFAFPSAALVDVDADGIRDLLASPFDPNLAVSRNRNSIWYYRNSGTNETPHFEYRTDRLFQQDMLDLGSAASPLLYDLNGDSRPDLIAGNYGVYDSSWYSEGVLRSSYTSRIHYFRNTGTSFEFVTADLGSAASLQLQGLYPSFSDLDADGFPDMIAGNADGTLLFFRNDGAGTDPPGFDGPVAKYQGIDVGEFSAPQLFDLDKDGLTDLIIGEKGGNLNYFRNTGTSGNPAFTFITDSLGGINVTNPQLSYSGYSTPCFFRTGDQETRLFVGSEEGPVYYYKDIDGNLAGAFVRSDSIFETVGIPSKMPNPGWRTAPATGHISDPDLMDVIIGNYSGGFNYFTAFTPPSVIPAIAEPSSVHPSIRLSVYPNPANGHISISASGTGPGEVLHLTIFDVAGRINCTREFNDQTSVNTSAWKEGFYILMVTGLTAGTASSHLIVIH